MKLNKPIKKVSILVTIAAAAAVFSGCILYANADSLFGGNGGKASLDQMNASVIESARKDAAAHPDKVANAKISPMEPDLKVKPMHVSDDAGWDGPRKFISKAYNVSGLWIVGDKPDYDMEAWNIAYAYSGNLKSDSDQGFIGTLVLNGESDNNWVGVWNTPGKWGAVTITAVSGDIVSFDTKAGVSGTFNLSSHEWSKN